MLYGGRSGEHEVSLASAAAVFANLDRARYEPVAIRIEKDGRWALADRPPYNTPTRNRFTGERIQEKRLRPERPFESLRVVLSAVEGRGAKPPSASERGVGPREQ